MHYFSNCDGRNGKRDILTRQGRDQESFGARHMDTSPPSSLTDSLSSERDPFQLSVLLDDQVHPYSQRYFEDSVQFTTSQHIEHRQDHCHGAVGARSVHPQLLTITYYRFYLMVNFSQRSAEYCERVLRVFVCAL